MLKNGYRYLVNNFDFFTRFQVWRSRGKFKSKILNDDFDSSLPTVHFIHRWITVNTGDIACGYYQYFLNEFLPHRCLVHDVSCIESHLIKPDDIVIIGGGGLLNATAEWNLNIRIAIKLAKKSIIWSAGFNSNRNLSFHRKIDWSIVSLMAIRDYSYQQYRYVPCATCMIPELQHDYSIVRRIGVVAHKDVPHHLPDSIHRYDRITNKDSLSKIIEFIGKSEVVLTNSYHAVYWSVLMSKKCVLFAPRSEKYNFYKYPPVLFSGNLEQDICEAVIYPQALQEAQKLTLNYLDEIRSLIRR